MSGENYRYARERLGLEQWTTIDAESGDEGLVTREPTHAEILTLLDALHADVTGVNTPEYEQALTDRWWNS